MSAADPVLSIERLSVSYGEAPVLRDIDLELRRGEVLGLVGESGSGKSTILYAIMNHLAPGAVIEGGAIRYGSVDLLRASRAELDAIRGRRLAMVYQDPGTALNPSIAVGAQVAEVRRRHFSESEAAARRFVLEALGMVGLEDPERIYRSYPHLLSGGQRQRVMIAMALAGEPDALLMDEPTTALDVIVQARILELVRGLKSRIGAAILFVSHDLGAVAGIADRIGVLYAGDLMEVGPAAAILDNPKNPYTRGLLAAIPRVDERAPLAGIPGSASRAPDRFAHCVFAGRCGLTEEVCRTSRPALLATGPERASRCHFAQDTERLSQWPRPAEAGPDDESPAATEPILSVEHLSVEYRRGGIIGPFGATVVHAVKDASFSLSPNRVLAIVGESGSGKTTIARTILRLEGKHGGKILFDGEEVFELGAEALRRFRRSVQIVFQNPTSSLNPRKTALDLVARPLRLAGAGRREAVERAADMLRSVGLGETFHARRPHELSGGEKQRVALARAFATEPALVILDEPTTALDVSVQASVLALLEELRRKAGCAYLLITHDLAVVRHIADDIVVMRAGEICETGPAEEIFSSPRHPYTRALLDAAPRIAPSA
jgi:peptide/nickel transport system ATP-binding protein